MKNEILLVKKPPKPCKVLIYLFLFVCFFVERTDLLSCWCDWKWKKKIFELRHMIAIPFHFYEKKKKKEGPSVTCANY